MGTEIERKFVLQSAPSWLGEAPSEPIEQGYLATGAEAEVRVRSIGGRPKLTVKSGTGLERGETEIDLDPAQFEALWPLTRGRRIEKVRHRAERGRATFEIDVYGGAHAGLVVAEIEFDSVAASEAFDPPAWLGEEVTGEERWANRSLAVAQAIPPLPADQSSMD
jgi:CYTH domain-containing protein